MSGCRNDLPTLRIASGETDKFKKRYENNFNKVKSVPRTSGRIVMNTSSSPNEPVRTWLCMSIDAACFK